MKKEMKLFTITSFLICSLIGVTFAQSNNEVLAYKDLLTEKKKAVHYKAAEENKNEIETVFSGLFKVYKNFILPKMDLIVCSTPHVQNMAYWR